MRFSIIIFCVLHSFLLCGQDLQWARVLNNLPPVTDAFSGEARTIKSDAAGNVYVCGFFEGTVDFDPGPGMRNLTSAGGSDGFFAKYDCSGNFVFAKALGGSSENDIVYSLALDNLGNIYLTGSFGDVVDFDPGPGIQNLTSAGLNDIFIARYD